MFGHAGNHIDRRFAQALRPVLPDQIMIAADPAGGDDHGLRVQREIAGDLARAALAAQDVIRLEDRTRDPIDRAVGDGERIDTVAEPKRQPAARLGFAGPPLERLYNAGAGAPADMEPRYRIAVPHRIIAAALRPADDREDPMAHGAEPSVFFASRERYIGFRPAPGP